MIQVAIKSGKLAKILAEHIPDIQVIPSKTVTEDFPNGKITIRPERWHMDNIANPDGCFPLKVRLTYKDVIVKKCSVDPYDYTLKVHYDLGYNPERKEWQLLPCLGQGWVSLDLFDKIAHQIKVLASIIKLETEKGI